MIHFWFNNLESPILAELSDMGNLLKIKLCLAYKYVRIFLIIAKHVKV